MGVNRYDQEEKNTVFRLSNYKRGLSYIKQYKIELLIIFILNCISVIATLFITKMIQYVIDEVIPNNNYQNLFIIVVGAFLLVLISILLKI